jgi:hypothetical protein
MSTDKWKKLITLYTQKRLTHKTDILPALAGIMNRMRGDTYHGGLWKSSLPYDLAWFTSVRRYAESSEWPTRPSSYVAPSFLWASIDGRICFFPLSHGTVDCVQKFSITEIHCKPKVADTAGELSSGSLTAEGPIIDATFVNFFEGRSWPADILSDHFEQGLECLWATLKLNHGEHCIFYPDTLDVPDLQYNNPIICFQLFSRRSESAKYSIALVLRKVSPVQAKDLSLLGGSFYTRIGIIVGIRSVCFDNSETREITII